VLPPPESIPAGTGVSAARSAKRTSGVGVEGREFIAGRTEFVHPGGRGVIKSYYADRNGL